jgi:hypothetical protein
MYYLKPEKPLSLAIFYGIGGTFILAIWILFKILSTLELLKKIEPTIPKS